MSDLYSKFTDSRDWLEKLASKIPGFGGYMDKETRRTADKMLRDTIVNRYGEQLRRIEGLQTDLLSSGGLEYLDELQTASIRLQTFVDQVRTAAYGYGGFFSAVKVDEAALSKLYAFDDSLLENVDKVSAAIDNIQASMGGDGIKAAIRNLITVASDSLTTFERRKEVLLS